MKILIATDGSEYSKGALDKCTAFFANGKAIEIKVVSVYENAYATIASEPFMTQPGYSEELIEASRKLAEGFTTSAQAFLAERFNGCAPRITSEVLDGIPAQQIVQKAADWNADSSSSHHTDAVFGAGCSVRYPMLLSIMHRARFL